MEYLKSSPQKYLMDGCKLLWYQDKLSDWINGERIVPISVDIGIHKGCNIRCLFCYGLFQKKSAEYIPTHHLLRFAEDCGNVGIKGVAIIGDGEPTLNRGLYPFVCALSDNNVKSAVATNGLLLDSRKIDILVDNCSWLRFNVSAIEDKYPIIHQGAKITDFRRLEKLLEHTVSHKKDCTIGLQMVLIPECFDQIIPFVSWAVKLGVDYAQIKQFSDAGEGMPMHFDMKEYDKVKELLKTAENMTTDKTKIKIKWKAMEDAKNIKLLKQWDFDNCVDLPFLFQISGDGKCYPCGYLFNNEEYCYGDITKESLIEILESDKYWNIIDKIKNKVLIELCEGQCRHTCSNQFMDRFVKTYKGNTKDTLIELCGSKEQYQILIDNSPEHLEFV